jgi:hypothetical protein
VFAVSMQEISNTIAEPATSATANQVPALSSASNTEI